MQQSMTVKEAMESRHSVRKFVQEPVVKEGLQEIINQARLAPSAWNLQPWRFHVVTDPEMKAKLQDAAYGQQQVTSAPAVIMVASDMEDVVANLKQTVHPGLSEEKKQEEVANLAAFFGGMTVEERGQWGLAQTNIALGFLLLAAQGAGYSTVPMLGFDPIKVRDILGLPDHVKFAAMVPIGHKDTEGYPHHRHSVNEIAFFH
ncbi:nitroreductase family protein [Paenibacillus xerothermodurans]|uniref:Nitroreductase family protein n=1 Tax=Paenibacillus xerothermodurans TaxID=1977292 RepID=A0A2W1NXZ9_PAEXE|nr:nitroreductase family protein [Paenibacillus xerothermodurans]PZE19718.1 nitroreductase family protein [Paenibacillus xerothermodurans]